MSSIMPDHLHLLLTPAADISLERALQLIKGGFSYRLGKAANAKRGLVWQESFTNHRIRDERDCAQHGDYIRMNPVRARLVERPDLYPYSSAACGRAGIDGGRAALPRLFLRAPTNAGRPRIKRARFLAPYNLNSHLQQGGRGRPPHRN